MNGPRLKLSDGPARPVFRLLIGVFGVAFVIAGLGALGSADPRGSAPFWLVIGAANLYAAWTGYWPGTRRRERGSAAPDAER